MLVGVASGYSGLPLKQRRNAGRKLSVWCTLEIAMQVKMKCLREFR